MKKIAMALIFLSSSSTVFAGTKDLSALEALELDAPAVEIQNVKKIVCNATAYYEEETPEEKTPSQSLDLKIFVPGTRKDVQSAKGAFLLTEYSLNENRNLQANIDQQYYFSQDPNGKIKFEFVAGWKANGELTLAGRDSATGFINQKSHVTELSCQLEK
jgi:hypothetical protein